VALMKHLPAPAPSASMKASVLDRLDAEGPVVRGPARWFSPARLVPVVAIAAAAVLVVVLRGGGRAEVPPAFVEEDQVLLAQNMELVEDLDLMGLSSPEDLEVVEQLDALEVKP
jgi:hypothetical protein